MVPPYVCTEGNGGLYEQFHVNVEGSGQLRENAQIFERLADEYNQHRFALKDALKAITVTYTGQGADAMQGAFTPLIESIGQGYDLCRRSAVLLTDQGGGFDVAQAKIQKPVDVPPKPWLNSLVPWDTAYDKAVEQNSHIDSGNQQAFAKYATTSLSNWAQAPMFDSVDPGFGDVTVINDQQKNPGEPGQGVHVRRPGGGKPGTDAGPVGSLSGPGGGPVQPLQHGDDHPGVVVPPEIGRDGGTQKQGYLPPPLDGGQEFPSPYGGERNTGGAGGPGPVGAFGSMESGRGGGRGPGSGLRGPGASRQGEGAQGGGQARAAAGARSAGLGARGGVVAGGRGGVGVPGGAGRREEDGEHRTAAYLVTEENGGRIVGELPSSTPPVIGG